MICSFCCVLLLITGPVFGQIDDPIGSGDIPDDPIIFPLGENDDLKKELDMNDLNRVILEKEGNENRATVEQFSQGSNPNLAKMYQLGEQNNAYLNQVGTNNATDIQQYGHGNIYSGTHDGKNIINTVIQNGTENILTQDLKASDLDFQIEQWGHGHELMQTETRNGIGYKVIQKGAAGMKITISQNNIYKQ